MKYKKSELESKSLLKLRPDIAKDWHYGKNKPLRPEDFFVNSHKKFGGNAVKDIHGKLQLQQELITDKDVQYVLTELLYQDIMT